MKSPSSQTERIRAALDLMVTSLQILDEAEAPADAGAHLDLAIHRLRMAIEEQAQVPTQRSS